MRRPTHIALDGWFITRTMALRDVFENFANQTTLHGVPKLINAKSTLARIFWSIICIAACSMFCMQVSEVLQRYFSYPKKVTVEVVPAPVPFPAISICNMRHLDVTILNTLNRKFIQDHHPINHINNSNPFISEYMKLAAKYGPLWYNYQERYPQLFQDMFSRTTFSSNIPQDVISIAAVQLDEFIVNCYYAGNDCNRSQEFTRFFDPYYFNCFTYKPPTVDGDITLSEGIENGWSTIVFSGSGMLDKNIEIRVLPGLHESKSAVSASEGVRVVIHPPGTQPFPFTEGYDVPPGFSASFGIRPRVNIRVGPPHGNCSARNSLLDTQPGINASNYEERYRMMSCQKMCLQNYVVKECGCSDISLPKLPNVNVKPCRTNDDFPDSCMFNASAECLGSFLRFHERTKCARTTRETVTKNTTLMEQCHCFPPCEEVAYDVYYSLSKWPASGYEGDAAYMDVFYIENFRERFLNTSKYEEIIKYFKDEDRNKTMRDFTRLNVYIADSNVIVTKESEDYTSNQLVSDIGGQLGLWVGISVITLAEVLELLLDLCRFFLSAKQHTAARRQKNIRDLDGNMCHNHKPQYTAAYTLADSGNCSDNSLIVMQGLNGDSIPSVIR